MTETEKKMTRQADFIVDISSSRCYFAALQIVCGLGHWKRDDRLCEASNEIENCLSASIFLSRCILRFGARRRLKLRY